MAEMYDLFHYENCEMAVAISSSWADSVFVKIKASALSGWRHLNGFKWLILAYLAETLIMRSNDVTDRQTDTHTQTRPFIV